MADTYLVVMEIIDGDNTYFLKELVTIAKSEPTVEDIIEEIYGELEYDEYNDCWDISNGMGYPLVRMFNFKKVKKEHLDILTDYGILVKYSLCFSIGKILKYREYNVGKEKERESSPSNWGYEYKINNSKVIVIKEYDTIIEGFVYEPSGRCSNIKSPIVGINIDL